MTEPDSSTGAPDPVGPGGSGDSHRETEVERLHRLESSSGHDQYRGGARRRADMSTVAGLDIGTRPDPAAPPTSYAQTGVTGRPSGSGPSRAKRMRRRGWGTRSLGLVGLLGFLVIWELLPRTGVVNGTFLPPASAAIADLFRNLGLTAFWQAVGDTMWQWLLGMLIACIGAAVVGFIVGSSTFLRRFTNSTIEFLRPVPSVALIPLAVLLFGVDIESALLLIVYASFWQVLIQVLYGVADVDNVAMNTARSYGLGPVARLRYVIFPTALPYLMTGIRLASAVALILAITAQLIIGNPGLGAEIAKAQSGGSYVAMYSLILATGLLGVLINLVMRMIERRVLSWHSSVRTEVAK